MTGSNRWIGDVVSSHVDRFFIGGEWVAPSTDACADVIDSATEEMFFRVALADSRDMDRAIASARAAFDDGPWPRMSHTERAELVRQLAAGMRERRDEIAQIWPRQSGVLHSHALGSAENTASVFDFYAGLATTFEFEEQVEPDAGGYGLLVREPVGVVGAIIAWNGPMRFIAGKVAPALMAGCSVVLKLSPEAPGEGYLVAEIAEQVGLPPGVLNVVTADREVSEQLVRDPRVDKITFTGSTAAGRRIASICGARVARCTLELGGKSAAILLDDADLDHAARVISAAECRISGQVCSSLTRIVVTRDRHDEFVDALAATFADVRVGDPFDPSSQMGPLATARQRDRVEAFIARGVSDGAVLATGGRRPAQLARGWYVEPTVFGQVDNRSTIAQNEIFGPVLSVIPADDEEDAIRLANDTIYGLNAAVFTDSAERALAVGRRLRSGSVGHNGSRTDLAGAFGGFKQSGIGREGGVEGLRPFLEVKFFALDAAPVSVATGPYDEP